MYKHILLAAELMEENRYVEDKAAQMQQLCDAKLSIIHVIESLPPVYAGVESDTMPDYSAIEKVIIERAEKMLKPIARRLGVLPSNAIVASGNVSNGVLSYAENNAVDLIIAGSHGRHGLQLILGSTVNALLHRANCDVLAVRLR